MTENRISASLTPEDQQAVLAAIATIKEKLPFLLGLSPEESKSLPRLGDKSRAFVAKALEVATQNPDFLPRSFDIEEMRKDVELFEALYPITLALSQLQELLDDTDTFNPEKSGNCRKFLCMAQSGMKSRQMRRYLSKPSTKY